MRLAKNFAFVILFCSLWSPFHCATGDCPANCTCDEAISSDPEDDLNVWISCPDRRADDTALTREIDAMLASMPDLTLFSIEHSPLTQVPAGVCNLTSLEFLILDDNRLVALPDNCLSRLSNLSTFSASNNRIAYLQDGLFDGLEFLDNINLSNNSIEGIGLRVFSNASDLPRLREIDLSNNNLTSLEPWPIIRGQVQSKNYGKIKPNVEDENEDDLQETDNLVTVRFDGNRILSFTNSANWTYACDGRADFFRILLCSADFPITDFIDEYFTLKGELPCSLHRRKSGIFESFFDPKDPQYSCTLLRIYESFDNKPKVGTVQIESIFPPIALYFSDIYVFCSDHYFVGYFLYASYEEGLNNILCGVKTGCPAKCKCFTTPYNTTLHVHCAGVGLKEAALKMPNVSSSYFKFLHTEASQFLKADPVLKYDYDVSGNNLALLEARPYFENTIIINASCSGIMNVSTATLVALQQADKIYLHDNLLTTLPRAVTTINFSFSSLSLHNNPLDCGCHQVWLKDWLTAIRKRLENSEGIHCETPPRLHGKTIWSVNESDFCYVPSPDPPDARIIASATVAPLLCIAAVILLLRIFRIESYKRFRFHPFDRDECAGEEMTYDVFISYAHGDKELARELLEFLEYNGCKVCFHQRDFVAGELIMENILEAVYTSKRVLCLVTSNFLRSIYCLDEFIIAQTRNVELKKRRLIIVKYEEFDMCALMEGGRTNEGEEQNPREKVDLNTQQLIPLNSSSQQCEDSVFDKALVLRDFVTRHTFINLSAADSWRDQLLYAMPIHRFGPANPAHPGSEIN